MADEDEVVDAGEEGGEEVDAEEGEGGDEAEEAEEAGSRASSRRSTPKPPSLIFDCGMRMELVLNRLRALHMDHLTRTAYGTCNREILTDPRCRMVVGRKKRRECGVGAQRRVRGR